MERLTVKNNEKGFELKNNDIEGATQKLGKYEEMQEALDLELRSIADNLEEMKLLGKEKTVTYKQLFTNKLMLINISGRLAIHDL